jgi:hypothetical protein
MPVMSNFKKAVLNTMEMSLLATNIPRCHFRQKQTVRRNIQTMGLWVLLTDSSVSMYFRKMLYCLSFFPPDKVTDIFENTFRESLDSNKMEIGFNEMAEEVWLLNLSQPQQTRPLIH